MRQLVVGVSDCQVSTDANDSLVTYALGSCVGVIVHDAVAKVGGMLHFMLPEAGMDEQKARLYPWMFADTGIPGLFHIAYNHGAEKRRLHVSVLGGAQISSPNREFDIGKRNYLAARKILWKAGVMIHAELVGGTDARTVRLEIGTGKVYYRTPGGPEQELKSTAKGATHGIPSTHRG